MDGYIDTNKHKFALLHDQRSPCAVFIGNHNSMSCNGIIKVNDWNYDAILQTVDQLRKNNIDAVPVFSELSLDPSKTIVTAGGIQTPVLEPNKLELAAKQIFKALDCGKLGEKYQGRYAGYSDQDLATCAPVDFFQMAPVSEISKNVYGKSFEAGLTHPNSDEFVKLRKEYGFDLEYELISGIEDKDLLPVEQIQKDNQFSLNSLYRGGCLGDTPYISFASRESKAFTYATPDIECAEMYSGLGGYGVHLSAISSEGKETKNFGLIYEFAAAPTTRLYGDYDIEQGYQPYISAPSANIKDSEWSGRNLETTITQSQNKLKNIYIHIKKDGNDMLYPIPLKDKKWQAFLALYRSSDTCLRGYMIDRRRKILAEKKVFSSLNNNKKFGIFKPKVKPISWELNNKEETMKLANLTIEEKQLLIKQSCAQCEEQKSSIYKKIKGLRCGTPTPKTPQKTQKNLLPLHLTGQTKSQNF